MVEDEGPRALALLAGLVPGIARAVGPLCEVALHDRSRPDRSIVAIGNGHVTGRRAGDPTTILLGTDGLPDDEDVFNYRTAAPDGRALRSSTLVIRAGSAPVGYLCFNLDVSRLETARRDLDALIEPESSSPVQELFLRGDGDWLGETVDGMRRMLAIPEGQPSTADRRRLVAALDAHGTFRMRGAAAAVAQRLAVGRATLYQDLQEARARSASVAPLPSVDTQR